MQMFSSLAGEPFFILWADIGQPGEGGGLGVADLTCRTGGFSVQEPRAAPAGQEAKLKNFEIIAIMWLDKTSECDVCTHCYSNP